MTAETARDERQATRSYDTSAEGTPPRRPRRGRVSRYSLVLAVLGAALASLAAIKAAQIATLIDFGKKAKKAGRPPEAVTAAVASRQSWDNVIPATASVSAAKGVEVSNDAAGIVSRLHFASGEQVREGKLLVELDSSVERAELESARARLALARSELERSRELVRKGAIAPARADSDESGYKSAAAQVESLQAQIARKQVRAPFTGKLGIRQVNLGQYLAPGTTVAVLDAAESTNIDFTLPQQYLGKAKLGLPVRVFLSEQQTPILEARIAAIDPSVDVSTRSFKARAQMPEHDERIHAGMFVTVHVVLPERLEVVSIPATALVHAAYGDSVFVLEPFTGAAPSGQRQRPLIARQQFVRAGEMRGDFVAILDGLSPGQRVVTSGSFKLQNGSPVLVRNDVESRPELDPHPPNR